MSSRPVQKRQKVELMEASNPTSLWWWDVLVCEIRSQGGYIDDRLSFLPTTRELTLDLSRPKVDEAIANDANADTSTIMNIPEGCLISPSRAKMWIRNSWWPTIDNQLETMFHGKSSSTQLHNPLEDVLLALALAYYIGLLENEGTNEVSTEDPSSDAYEDVGGIPLLAKAYLASIPQLDRSGTSSLFLPRQWPEEKRQKWLQGSPVLKHARQAQAHLTADFEFIQRLYDRSRESSAQASSTGFPVAFSHFDHMIAMVTSRAFGFPAKSADENDDIALVPLLDLGNHSRGPDESKTISYEFQKQTKMLLVRTTTPSSAMIPGALASLPIRLTYGAKSNAQLLMNYGFCLEPTLNMEPDGSSNDLLEWSPGIYLQTGPKAYTYDRFSRVLDLFLSKEKPPIAEGNCKADSSDRGEHESRHQEDTDEEMEAFLNGEETHGDGDDGYELDMYGSDVTRESCEDSFDQGAHIRRDREIKALQDFCQTVDNKLRAYIRHDKDHAKSLVESIGPKEFARLLIRSEKQILFFFRFAAGKILRQLDPEMTTCTHGSEEAIPPCVEFLSKTPSDIERTEQQANELANAFLLLRNGSNTGKCQ